MVWRRICIRTPVGLIPIGEVPDGLAWVRDPRDDYTEWPEVDSVKLFASYQDFLNDLRFAAETVGETAYTRMAEVGSGGDLDAFTKAAYGWVGREAGRKLVEYLKDKGVMSPEDVWDARYTVTVGQFKESCKQKCKSLKGKEK